MGSGSLRATAMFEDEFRTDMEEVEAERLVSEATAADALTTWGLEVPLVSPSPARAGWILCAAHSAPKEGERRASAGARGAAVPSGRAAALDTEALQRAAPAAGAPRTALAGAGHGSKAGTAEASPGRRSAGVC